MTATNRGKPLPWKLRDEIQRLRQIDRLPIREVARQLGVSKTTVVAYGPEGLRADEK